MKLRKILSAFAVSAVLTVTALPMSAFAAADGGFTSDEINSSSLKPTLSVSKINISAEEAKASPVQTINISIKGADTKYSSTGFHVYLDSKLSLVKTAKGGAAAKGSAISELSSETYSKGNCVFLATAGKPKMGADGVMWSIQVKLPDNVSDGDTFPIKLAYEKGKVTEDVFIDDPTDKNSQLMQAWIFTKGMEDGYIKIGSAEKTVSLGDANCSGSVDISDAVLIMQYVANPDKYGLSGTDKNHMTEAGLTNSDVSGGNDGVTSKDALAIQKYTLKIISKLPEK